MPELLSTPTDHPTTTRKCSAEYSPALAHLNPITRATSKPLNSARQSLHSLHFVTLSWSSVGKRCSAEKNPHRRCSPLRSVCATRPTPHNQTPSSPRPPSYRPTPAKAPIRRRLRKSNHAGSLSAFAHNQSDTHNSTGAALRFAPFAQPAQFHPTIPPSPITRKCSAEYSPALAHLNPTTRATSKPLNSAHQSLHFASLRYAFIPLSRSALFSGKESS